MSDFSKVTPPKELSSTEQSAIFQHIFRRLAASRNTAELYALAEYTLSNLTNEKKSLIHDAFVRDVNRWAQNLLQHAWLACDEPGGGALSL